MSEYKLLNFLVTPGKIVLKMYERRLYNTIKDYKITKNIIIVLCEDDLLSGEGLIKLKSFLNINQLDGLGIDDESVISIACAGIIDYIQQIEKRPLLHIEKLKIYHLEEYMILDNHTQVNLELVHSLSFNSRQGSLLWALDHTATAMGARRIKSWILTVTAMV